MGNKMFLSRSQIAFRKVNAIIFNAPSTYAGRMLFSRGAANNSSREKKGEKKEERTKKVQITLIT